MALLELHECLHLWIQTFSLRGINLLQMIEVEKKWLKRAVAVPSHMSLAPAAARPTGEMNNRGAVPPGLFLHGKEQSQQLMQVLGRAELWNCLRCCPRAWKPEGLPAFLLKSLFFCWPFRPQMKVFGIRWNSWIPRLLGSMQTIFIMAYEVWQGDKAEQTLNP